MLSNESEVTLCLFWDTDFDKLDWNTNKRYIINRIFERGNEKKEIYKLAIILSIVIFTFDKSFFITSKTTSASMSK